MDLWPTHLYHQEGERLGFPLSTVAEALRQAHRTQSRGFPAILTLHHLAERTETAYEDLRAYVEARRDPYRTFRIAKRSGGRRLICIPEPALMRVQRWIAQHILNRVSVHPASAAYSPGASVVKCAQRHCGSRWLLKVDIAGFFESISEIQAYRVFDELGYNALISFEMARLCARRYGLTKRNSRRVWQVSDKWYSIRQYNQRQVGHLPQGAPTSPMLSNLAMRGVDAAIQVIADRYECVFTRYADDLTFSSASNTLARPTLLEFLNQVNKVLRAEGLMPNRSKTVIAPPGARKIVLGLLVDHSTPRLQKEFKRRLSTHAYFISKFGPASHALKRGFRSVGSMRRHLNGLIAHAGQVEPTFASEIETRLSRIDWGPFDSIPA